MSLGRETRIRWIASAVVLTAALLFTHDPSELPVITPSPSAATSTAASSLWGAGALLCNLLLVVLAVAGLRHAWHGVRGIAPALSPAASLPWLLLFCVVLIQGVAGVSQLGGEDAPGAWSLLPTTLTLAAFIGAACSEHIGLREGVFTLPVLLALAVLAVYLHFSQADGRYLIWLQLTALMLPMLLCALLPVTTSARSDWLASAALLGLAQLVLLTPAAAAWLQPLATAAATLALLRGLRSRPLC